MKRLSRRTALRGLLGGAAVTVGLPWLEALAPARRLARAAGTDTGLPRAFVLWFWGNGNLPDRWRPTGVGAGDAWQLSEQLAPLARHKDALAVVTGMAVKVGNEAPHGSGPAGMLGGAPLVQTSGDDHTFGAPSIDQVLAQAIGGDTRFRSIEAAAERWSGKSHNGPYSLNPAESSPHALFERVFGAGFTAPGEEPIVDPTLALRRSVLDAVTEDSARLMSWLGAADRARVDQHLTGVRELELRLARMEADPPDLAACSRPGAPVAEYPDIEGRAQLSEINAVMGRLLAMALACDQARVVSQWFTAPVSNVLFPGAPAGHHQMTHDEPGVQAGVHDVVIQIMEAFAEFLDALREVPEGDGTLLDRCCVMATSDVSLGRNHTIDDYPILLAGGAGGRLKTDVHYASPSGENTSHVGLSVLRAMGLSLAEWGVEGGRVTNGLGAIET